MNKLLPVLLCAAVSVPAGAQQFEKSVGSAMAQISWSGLAVPAVVAQSARRKKMMVALDETLTAMNDGNEVGGQVASFVREHKVPFRFEDQQPVSRTDGKEIVLDVKMSAYPRAMAPRIAWEAAPMMLADMPESQEKEYMRRSITARVWLELGGEPSKLPVVEPLSGDQDPELAKEMRLWLSSGAELALYKIGQATKTSSLLDQLDQVSDPAKRAKLEAANERFVAFIMAENQWRQANPR